MKDDVKNVSEMRTDFLKNITRYRKICGSEVNESFIIRNNHAQGEL